MCKDEVFGYSSMSEFSRRTYNGVCLKQLLDFLRVNRSKSKTSEDVISVITWLAEHLDTDVHSIKQELQVSTGK